MVKCPQCDGEGSYRSCSDEYHPGDYETCPTCKGKGTVTEKKAKKFEEEEQALFKLSTWW